jgi:PAS domain S-box-containing protein
VPVATALPEISQCEIEPIHLAGSIQPHGALLALAEPSLRITQASVSCYRLLGVAAAELLEREVATVLGPALAELVRAAVEGYAALPDAPASFAWRSPKSAIEFAGYIHRCEGLVVLELEPEVSPAPSSYATLPRAVLTSRRMRACADVAGKAQGAAESLRQLTGYERVMIYRFHDDHHGEVIAEARGAELKPYLGFHYPASDIPAQARRMFLICPTRAIVDVEYVPNALLPTVNSVTGRPLDLSRSVLRSVSPVHLQYLRNMGVGASLTSSLLREGKLWGLIACHDTRPHLVSREVRDFATWLAQDLSAQITIAEELRDRGHEAHLKRCRDKTLVSMSGGARLSDQLGGPELADLLGAIEADGVALVRGKEITTGGVTPDSQRVLEIVSGLGLRHGDASTQLFATECLSEHLPEMADVTATAAGVAMFSLPAEAFTLMWFRGEMLRSLTWGGNPDKALNTTPDGRIEPRRSFSAWAQSVRSHSRPWRDEELESARQLRTMIEIELRSMAQDTLRQSEVRFRNLFESQSVVMLLVDAIQGSIVDANPAAAQLYGFERQVLRAMNFTELNGLSAEECLRQLDAPTQTDTNHWLQEHRLANGSFRTVKVTLSHLEVEGRSIRLAIMEDVTERERAQAALTRERERYLTLLNIAQDGIHVLDVQGRLVEANNAFLLMLGQSREQVGRLNVRDWDASIPAADMENVIRQTVASPRIFETRHRRSDGQMLDVEISAGGVELDGGMFLLATSRDISARKELERQVIAKQAQLEALNCSLQDRVGQAVTELRSKDQLLITQGRHAAMGEMIGNIAHQWRQPLNALGIILANLRDASRFGGLDAPAVEEAVGESNRLIAKMSSTINDFRDFLTPEKRKGIFSARAEILETLRLVDASYRHVGIEFMFEEMSDVSLVGFSNEYSQVVLNLLSNAKEAIQASKVARGLVTLRLEKRQGLGCLAVRDNGSGIPEALLDRIFEPYFSTKEGGSGIGLYMSRQIVEKSLGGRLEAKNVEGGAEFTVLTPLAVSS